MLRVQLSICQALPSQVFYVRAVANEHNDLLWAAGDPPAEQADPLLKHGMSTAVSLLPAVSTAALLCIRAHSVAVPARYLACMLGRVKQAGQSKATHLQCASRLGSAENLALRVIYVWSEPPPLLKVPHGCCQLLAPATAMV